MKKIIALLMALILVVSGVMIGGNSKNTVHAEENKTAYTAAEMLASWGSAPAEKDGAIFAGWFSDEEMTKPLKSKPTTYTEGAQFYPKYVDEDILSVKVQVEQTSNGTYNVRLVSSVDSLDYKNVGFNIRFGKNNAITYKATTVYERIYAKHMEEAYVYSPKVVSIDSKYMFSVTLTGITYAQLEDDFYVVPTVTTYDRVTSNGPSRMFSVNDGLNDANINLSMKAENPFMKQVDVKVGDTTVQADVIDYTDDGYVHLNIPVNRDELDSTTVISYKSEEVIYRNLYSANSVDTSWYDVNASADEYIVSTMADLYGLAKLANETGNVFTGKTIYLISDIEFNEVNDSIFASWISGTKPTNKWVPIGYWATNSSGAQEKKYFNGTFDGQGHSLTGLYGVDAAKPIGGGEYYGFGLFTAIDRAGAVKNLEIDYCYYNPKVNGIGTITGMLYGTIDNVYISENTHIGTTKLAKGGVAGRTYGGTISNTWFAGTIQGSAGNGYLGGIVGQVDEYVTMTNVLFTGNIHLTNAGTYGNGGLVGHIFGAASVEFTNCLYAGTMTNTASDTTAVASIVGGMNSSSYVYMNNVYMMSKPSDKSNSVVTEECGLLGIGYRQSNTSVVNGSAIMPTTYTDLYKTFHFDYWSENNEDGAWAAPKNAGALPVLKEFSGLTKNDIAEGNSGTTPSTGWYSSKLYEINTVSDLYGLADLVNNQGVSMKGVTVALRADLNLNPGWDAASGEAPENGRVWVPIGTASSPFKGIFTGANHTISGLYMTADQGYQGLFGYVDSGSVKNLRIENSYYDFTNKATVGHEGSVAGSLKDGLLYNVIADVDIATVNGYTGGIVGSVDNAKVQNVWYKGNITVENEDSATAKEGYGGVVGSVKNGYTYVINSMFDGTMTVKRAGNYYAAGLVGIASAGTKVSVKESLATGILSFTEVTEKNDTDVTVEIESVYTSSQSQEEGVKVLVNGVAQELTDDAKTWINRYTAAGTVIAPELNENDGVIRVLLIGNSFCYYHTDELYGMLASDGSEAIVANVYESGCPVVDHWKWLNDGSVKYNYITVTENGRKDHGLQSLKYCLAQEDWDVISLQQHFNPGSADTYETAANGLGTLTYAKLLYDYLKEYHPQSRLVWQQTWAYQIGYKGPSNTTSSDTSQHVLTVEKQTTNYENIRDTAIEVCRQNNVTRVPNGDAWQIARGVVGDILCDKSGTDLAEDTKVGDNYHDGDIGGGQLLNAYGFYEIITGMDCRDNTYLPPYADAMLINSKFNPELQTTTDVINALKEAAHSAVEAMKQ